MANNTHGYISTANCACWDVDSLNLVGTAAANMDNGTFVDLGALDVNAYSFTVTASTGTGEVYVVNTPEVGNSIEMQLMADPRYFYNEAGQPMSIKHILLGDVIEVTAPVFSTDVGTNGFASISAGKLVPAATAPSSGKYFRILGSKNIAIGSESVVVYLAQRMA